MRQYDILVLVVQRAPSYHIISHLLDFPTASLLLVDLENYSIHNKSIVILAMSEEKEGCIFEALNESQIQSLSLLIVIKFEAVYISCLRAQEDYTIFHVSLETAIVTANWLFQLILNFQNLCFSYNFLYLLLSKFLVNRYFFVLRCLKFGNIDFIFVNLYTLKGT